MRNWFGNTLFLDATLLTPERVGQVISAMRRFRPKVLLGYTSCMTTVARSLLKSNGGLALPDLKIVNAAEPIDSSKRVLIESAFGGELYDHYGTREIGYIADECEFRKGMHVHMEYLILEIVDEQGGWVQDGQEGEILITGLENYGMPLLRYRIGDRGVKTDAPCPCGRGLEIVSSITGRSTDTIILPNGNKLTGLIFPHALKDFQVIEYQIRQKSIDEIDVMVVLEPTAAGNTVRSIYSALQQIMPGMTINVNSVNEIQRTKSGKLRSVVSELSGSTS
jgi:phenylacetate-CoA ligase